MNEQVTTMELSWNNLLGQEKQKPYFTELMAFVASRRQQGVNVFPEQADVFNALRLTPANNVKVVILGQDPYHGRGQAHGLCFSVQKGIDVPPSLRNIYKELSSDIEGFTIPPHGNLSSWAEQGVLLLNTVLTVEEGQAHSHKGKGWETFTDTVISQVSANCDKVVFLLWGKPAQQKIALIDTSKHNVLTSTHPSPLSAHRGFLGCQHFSQANTILANNGKQPIDWQIR